MRGWGSVSENKAAALLTTGLVVGAFVTGLSYYLRGKSKEEQRRDVILEHIRGHRSIRKFKQDEDISDAMLENILQTAFQSSNNGNMQVYSVVVTRDKALLKQLALIHDNDSIEQAGLLLTFVADWTRMERWCEARKARTGKQHKSYNNFNAYMTGALDAMVTAQAVALSAEACGLGICFLGSTIWEPDRLHRILSIPEGAHVVTSIMMGWPDEHVADARARLDFRSMVHMNDRYDAALNSEENVCELYRDREREGWERYMHLYGENWRAKVAAHRCENLAQVYTQLKYSGSDFRRWSKRFLDSLNQQGFGANEQTSEDGPCDVCGKLSHCLDPVRFSK